MTVRYQTYKCGVCGNIVEVLHASGGTLSCCGQAMNLLEENTVDAAQEKHVPVVEAVDGGFAVAVGSVTHPMEEGHFIEWIELLADGRSYTCHLSPGDEPKVTFKLEASEAMARAYCNLHGLWKG